MSGLLPNVFHQAVPLAQLRVDPRFEALPPAHTLCLAGTACYRFVRQEDELWGRLHAGMLTTGYLPAALAFYEQGCVRRLGIGKARCVLLGVCVDVVYVFTTAQQHVCILL